MGRRLLLPPDDDHSRGELPGLCRVRRGWCLGLEFPRVSRGCPGGSRLGRRGQVRRGGRGGRGRGAGKRQVQGFPSRPVRHPLDPGPQHRRDRRGRSQEQRPSGRGVGAGSDARPGVRRAARLRGGDDGRTCVHDHDYHSWSDGGRSQVRLSLSLERERGRWGDRRARLLLAVRDLLCRHPQGLVAKTAGVLTHQGFVG